MSADATGDVAPATTAPPPGRSNRSGMFAFPLNTRLLLFLMAATVYCGNIYSQTFAGNYPGREARSLAVPVLSALWIYYLGVSTFMLRDRLRRRGSRPLDREKSPRVVERVEVLAKEMGLKRTPALLSQNRRDKNRGTTRGTTQFDMRPYGMASGTDLFGMRPYLALGSVLLAYGSKDEKDPKNQESVRKFDAIIRHELAHLRNRDVPMQNLAVGVRWANLAQALVFGPLSLAFGILDGRPELIGSGVAVAVFTLVVEMMVLEFYRSREDYADQRAAQYGQYGPEDLARALLAGQPDARPATRRTPGWLARVRPLFSSHRSPEERAALLRDPAPLFRFSTGYTVLAGFLVGAVLATVPHAMSAWYSYGPAQDRIVVTTAVLTGAPLGVFTALGMWRHTWNAAAAAQPPRPLRHAACLALGVLVGSHSTPYGTAAAGVPLLPLPLLSLLICCLLLTYWPWAVARAAAAAAREPGVADVRQMRTLAVASAVVGACAFALLMLGGLDLLALYGLLIAAPLLGIRLCGLLVPAETRERFGRTLRSGGRAVAAACNGLLLLACAGFGERFGRAAQDNWRIRPMIANQLLLPAWLEPVSPVMLALSRSYLLPLTLALAVCAVAALGPRSTGGPNRRRLTALALAPVLAMLSAAGVWRGYDAQAILYCSPLTPQDGKVIVFLDHQERTPDPLDIYTELKHFDLDGPPQYEDGARSLKRHRKMFPDSPLADVVTPDQFDPTVRVDLRNPADYPALRAAVLRHSDWHADPQRADPCHPTW